MNVSWGGLVKGTGKQAGINFHESLTGFMLLKAELIMSFNLGPCSAFTGST